jgi:hypothetical protein
VGFYIATLAVDEVLEPPTHVVEGRVDRGVEVLVRLCVIRRARCDKLASRQREIDTDAVVLAVPRVPMRHLERDVAAGNPRRQ